VEYGLGQVAQWIELLTTDQKVGGSNPSLLTNIKQAGAIAPACFFVNKIRKNISQILELESDNTDSLLFFGLRIVTMTGKRRQIFSK
jgi:hypothetical protein